MIKMVLSLQFTNKQFRRKFYIIILKRMTEQTLQSQQQLSQYEKFRLKRLINKNQDDNLSAHFSNISANISILSKSDRNINTFRSSYQNQEEIRHFEKEIHEKNASLYQLQKKHSELEIKYQELMKNYKLKTQQAQKYKKLYENQINKQKETKLKLKNWVKEAKTNLNN